MYKCGVVWWLIVTGKVLALQRNKALNPSLVQKDCPVTWCYVVYVCEYVLGAAESNSP